MAVKSNIQWTDATINFWMGCKKVSAGCKFCYMFRILEKDGKDATAIFKVSGNTIYNTLNKLNEKKIFTNSMSDFFSEEGDEYRPWAWKIIDKHKQYDWQILTKRPERIKECLPDDWDDRWKQVWLGVSTENQAVCEERFSTLKDVPGYIKFASVEPLLEQINLRPYLKDIHWLIVGGESGNDYGAYRYRPCKIEWIEDVVNQCKEARVPVFVKQLGTYLHHEMKLSHWHGGNINEFPPQLRIRQFPAPVIR